LIGVELKKTKLKIFLVTSYPENSLSLMDFYNSAFSELKHQTRLVPISERFRVVDRIKRQISRISYRGFDPDINGERLINEFNIFKPDLTIICKGERLKGEAIKYLRQNSKFGCINIYTDSPMVNPGPGVSKMMSSMKEYTHVYTFANSMIPVFYQMGAKSVSRLAFGFDPNVHFPFRSSPPTYSTDIAYFGSWGPFQEAWLNQISNMKIKIYGTGWKHTKKESPIRYSIEENRGIGKNMSLAINGANLIINFVRAEHGCFHSMKTFEIPACGGFMVTNWTEEQAEFFDDDVHCVYFRSKEELLDKLDYYLKHETQRKKIASAGLLAAANHTYINRAKQILNEIVYT